MSQSVAAKMFTAVRGVIYALGFIFLWGWFAVSVRRYDAMFHFTMPSGLRLVGIILALVGIILAAMCVATFATRGRGTPAPFDAPRVFVATGPYRYVRNPMYVGAFGVLLGSGLTWQSPSIVLLAFGALLLAHIFVLVYEEPTLTDKFGESYLLYKGSVNRWIPRIPKQAAG
jgi:protein-S-isoprenylcysteine O-methyltransferase Ste14